MRNKAKTVKKQFSQTAKLVKECCPPVDVPSDKLTRKLNASIKKYAFISNRIVPPAL